MNGKTQTQTQNQSNQTQTQTQQPERVRRMDTSDRGFLIPPANISATDDEYLLEVDMPGVDKAGLEITVEGNELTLIGRRQADLPEGTILYSESPLADYRRVFELGPDVDTARIRAEMHQGVLKLHLPKSEQAKPKRIEIQGA